MKVKLFCALSILFPFALAANGPTGQLMLNNDTQWHLLITYKDSQGKVQTKQMAPAEQEAQIPVAGVYKNNFIRVEHNNRLYNPMTAPAKNDGKTILAAIEKYKNDLNESHLMVINISLIKNNFNFAISVKSREKFNEEKRQAQAALLSEKELSEKGFVHIEKNEEQAVLDQALAKAKQLKTDAELQDYFKDKDKYSEKVPLYRPLSLIALVNGFKKEDTGVYKETIFFDSEKLMQGKRGGTEVKGSDEPILKKYANTKNAALIPIIIGEYKIHLMPKKEHRIKTVDMLLKALNDDKDEGLRRLIHTFKVVGSDRPYNQETIGNHIDQNAVIVIYPADGKENAQKALNKIYELYKPVDKEYGMNVRPRYNAKVTDLIWIAQGDGQVKGGSWGEYYEEPDRIYYNPKAFGRSGNFHLKHPETGKDLIAIK